MGKKEKNVMCGKCGKIHLPSVMCNQSGMDGYVSFNINSIVYVQLTAEGREELKRQYAILQLEFPKTFREYKPIPEDAEGWSKWQLWALMEQLGHLCKIGVGGPFATEIKLKT